MQYKKTITLPMPIAVERIWFHITSEPYTLNYEIPRFHTVCQAGRLLNDIMDLALLRLFKSERFCEKFISYKWTNGMAAATCIHPLGEVRMTFRPTIDFDVVFEFYGNNEEALEALCRIYHTDAAPE